MNALGTDSKPVLWGELNWPQIRDLANGMEKIAIFPLGTTEQHGRHLPVDVDMRNCWEIALAVSARTNIPVLPGLAYGNSSYWTGWPGTLTLSADTLRKVIFEVARGVCDAGFKRLLLLNGHVGNGPTISLSENEIRDQIPGMQIRALSWWDVSKRVSDVMYADSIDAHMRSFHANDGETSVYLVHSPELVFMDQAIDEPKDFKKTVFSYHSRKVTRSGTIGIPSRATVERGKEIFNMAVEDIANLLRSSVKEDIPDDIWDVGRTEL